MSAPTGVITSPNFNRQYPNNLDCRWLIRHVPGKEIDLVFSDFNTQGGYDRLEIYQGPRSTDKKWQLLNGESKPRGSFFSPEYMYLRFVTNAQNDKPYRGFRAEYKGY